MYIKLLFIKILLILTCTLLANAEDQYLASTRNVHTLRAEKSNIFEQIFELFRPLKKTTPTSYDRTSYSLKPNIDCMTENGADYRGPVDTTVRGSKCLPWHMSDSLNADTHPNAGLLGHNYCRNPDEDKGPWCWVDTVAGKFGFCSIPKCHTNAPPLTTTAPATTAGLAITGQRLVGSTVQVRLDRYWYTVCSDDWTEMESVVACRLQTSRSAANMESMSAMMANQRISCLGSEADLASCQLIPVSECLGGPARVTCSQNLVCNEEKEMYCLGRCVPLQNVCDGISHCFNAEDESHCEFFEVRLVGGKNRGEGRVELSINGMAGSICDDGWDDADAAVVCRMLGYAYGTAVSGGEFGRGQGPIWFDDVGCNGYEEDIQLCPRATTHDCTHFEDAGVTCHRFINSNQSASFSSTKRIPNGEQECGRRPIMPSMGRVIGGQAATYGAFPWQGRIIKRDARGKWFQQCGASLVHREWVVTAAHCVESNLLSDYLVRMGDWRTSRVDSVELEFSVVAIVRHPDYGQLSLWNLFFYGVNYDYDIAALKIYSRQTKQLSYFNDHIQPACLPTPTTNYKAGLRCEVSGWGINDAQPTGVPDVLHWAMVPILGTRDCQTFYRQKMTSNMFCAGYREGNIDTCQGDSGGPLVCLVDGHYTLLGVTSWGHGCGNENSPGIYTKVSKTVDWLQNIMRNN